MRIDVQCHIFPEEYGDYLVKYAKSFKSQKKGEDIIYDNGAIMLAMDLRAFEPESLLAAMDNEGVDLSLISCTIPDPGLLPAEYVVEGCNLANNAIKEYTEKYPGRFRGIACLPWNRPDEALHCLDDIVQNRFCGVMLFSHNGGMHTDDFALEPLYAKCSELNLPVVLHPSVPLWSEHISVHGMVSSISFVMDTVFALLRMIYSGVFERNRGLKLLMPHMGGVLPFLDGRLGYFPESARRQGIVGRGPEFIDFIRSGPNIWYDFANPSSRVADYGLSYFSADKILFGSDYPYIDRPFLIDILDHINLSKEDMEKINWKNANKLFKLGLD